MLKLSTFIFLFASAANASYHGPLLKRVTLQSNGTEESAQSQCTIYPDKVREAKSVGGALEVEETRQVHVATASVMRKINEAAKGKITESLGRKSGMTQVYRAIHVESDGNIRAVVLSQQGAHTILNDSRAAVALKNFIDETCK